MAAYRSPFEGKRASSLIRDVQFATKINAVVNSRSAVKEYSGSQTVASVENPIHTCINENCVNDAESVTNHENQQEELGSSFDLELDLTWYDGLFDSNNFCDIEIDESVNIYNSKNQSVECRGTAQIVDHVNQLDNLSKKDSYIDEAGVSPTYVGTLSDTFEVDSNPGADFLNTTYDIIEVENTDIIQLSEVEDINKNVVESEKSTMDGVVHFIENRLDENAGLNVTYVLKSRSDGSVEVELNYDLAKGDDTEMNNEDTSSYEANLCCDGSDEESVDLSFDAQSDYGESSTLNESSSHFEIFPLGSNNYRDNKGYIYTKNNCRATNLYLRCKNNIKHGCKARVTVRNNNFEQAVVTIKHNHPHDSNVLEKSIFDKLLEQNVENDPFETPRQLYLKTKKELLNKINTESIPPLKKREGFIYRRQKKFIPKLPLSIEEFEKYVSDERYKDNFTKDHRNLQYYRGVWTSEEGERNLVYISETILKLINTKNSAAFFIDGTFKALPHHLQFRQLYVISIIYDDQCYPLAYIFMEKKTFSSYDTVFANLKWLMPSVEVTKVMSDYEAATRKALKKHYPNARVSGCFFHYVQAIVKAVKRFGLKSDNRFKDAIKQLCALALLPNDFVLKGFRSIDSSIKFQSKRWSSFKKYWMKQWLPANISVFGLVNRTNNFSESNNKSLNLLLKGRHPNIWRLIMNLKLLEMDKSDLIKRAAKGEMIHTKRNADMIRLNDKIEKATESFEEEQDVEKFLRRVTFEENLELFVKDQVDIMNADCFEDDYDCAADEEVVPNHYNVESDFRKSHPRKAAEQKN